MADDIIYEVTKTKYLKECVPKTDTKHQTVEIKILTKQGSVTFNIPPPPLNPPHSYHTINELYNMQKKRGTDVIKLTVEKVLIVGDIKKGFAIIDIQL